MPESGRLLANVVQFARQLRLAGIEVTPSQTIAAIRGLEIIEISERADFLHVLRTTMVVRHAHWQLFDRLFARYWRSERRGGRGGEQEWPRPATATSATPMVEWADGEAAAPEPGTTAAERRLAYTARESLRSKDFSQMTGAEIEDLESLMRALRLELPWRRSRRRIPARAGSLPDLRRSLRRGLRHGGETFRLHWRKRKPRPRPLVLLCDISGSMEAYSRILLQFALAVSRRVDRFEAFVFGTRLTRITRQLAERDVRRALRDVSDEVVDWGGGTRIGEALKGFNFVWARRVLGQGAVVAIISDGWDRGEPDLLGRELGRLKRSCDRLLWLNPLLGSPDYQPLTRGMQAALPLIDEFLPVHNLASLEALARHLGRLCSRAPRSSSAIARSP